MNFNYGDRVRETSTTTGTTDLTLLGAVTQYQTFSSKFAANVYFPYVIVHQTLAEWECGMGYLSGGILIRDIVTDSNTGSKISFNAGTKDVWCDVTAYAMKTDNGGLQIAINMGTYFI